MSRTSPTRSERAPLVTDAIPPNLRRRGVSQRQAFVTVLAGALVLALFASRDTPGWADRLGDAPLAHQTRDFAVAWDAQMARFGLTRPHELLRAAMDSALGWSWTGDSR